MQRNEMKQATTQAELQRLLDIYFGVREELRKVDGQLDNLKPETLPNRVDQIETAYALFHKQAATDEIIGELKTQGEHLRMKLKYVEEVIMDSLPFYRMWVHVGEHAIGKCRNAWGGLHAELLIKPWANSLPPLHDKLDYP